MKGGMVNISRLYADLYFKNGTKKKKKNAPKYTKYCVWAIGWSWTFYIPGKWGSDEGCLFVLNWNIKGGHRLKAISQSIEDTGFIKNLQEVNGKTFMEKGTDE